MSSEPVRSALANANTVRATTDANAINTAVAYTYTESYPAKGDSNTAAATYTTSASLTPWAYLKVKRS